MWPIPSDVEGHELVGEFLDQQIKDSVKDSVKSTTYVYHPMLTRRYFIPDLGQTKKFPGYSTRSLPSGASP
jgi:hypothetical protein